MTKGFNLYLFFTVIFILSACEGIVGSDGKVIDAKTKEPISGVSIFHYLDGEMNLITFSNKNGEFKGSQFVGCVPKCPKSKLVFKKNNYYSKTVDFSKFKVKKDLVVFLKSK
jgi:hypothetical protein